MTNLAYSPHEIEQLYLGAKDRVMQIEILSDLTDQPQANIIMLLHKRGVLDAPRRAEKPKVAKLTPDDCYNLYEAMWPHKVEGKTPDEICAALGCTPAEYRAAERYHRQQVHPKEAARILALHCKGYTSSEIACKLGRSPAFIRKKIKALTERSNCEDD